MAPADCDPELEPHELGQQLAARNDRNLQTPRFLDFGIAFVHRGSDHNSFGAGHIGRAVPFVDHGAESREPGRDRGQLQVGSADGITQIQQHFGDAAHPDASDTDEMQVLIFEKHLLTVLFLLYFLLSIGNRDFSPSGRRPPPTKHPRRAPQPRA